MLVYRWDQVIQHPCSQHQYFIEFAAARSILYRTLNTTFQWILQTLCRLNSKNDHESWILLLIVLLRLILWIKKCLLKLVFVFYKQLFVIGSSKIVSRWNLVQQKCLGMPKRNSFVFVLLAVYHFDEGRLFECQEAENNKIKSWNHKIPNFWWGATFDFNFLMLKS